MISPIVVPDGMTVLPCPFCGKPPSIGMKDPGAPFPGGYFYCQCDSDECPVWIENMEKARFEDGNQAIVRAIERWNTRFTTL